jgi:hypothetical protein
LEARTSDRYEVFLFVRLGVHRSREVLVVSSKYLVSALPLNTVSSKITVRFRSPAWMPLSVNSSVPVRYATIPRSVPALVPTVQAPWVLADERV